ncbi:type III secretion system export apparatus subunit SctT [Burkholderia dolosa]|nr:type III secretion system export apparatus subunit SctT [Burkholderia dolosa]
MNMLMDLFYARLGTFALGFARVAPVFYLLPFLSDRTIANGIVRNTVVVIVVIGLWPSMTSSVTAGSAEMLWQALNEAVTGLVLGVTIALPFWVATSVGELIDNQRGATARDTIVPGAEGDASTFAPFMSMFYSAAFLQQGGMVSIMKALRESYAIVPVGAAYRMDLMHAVPLIDSLASAGLSLAAPVLIATFVTDALLGLYSRMCPQVNAFSLSLTIKTFVALVIFHLYFGGGWRHLLSMWDADTLRHWMR